MRSRLFGPVSCLLLVAITASSAHDPARQPSHFRGKTLGEWAQGLDDSNPRVRCRSAAALGLSRFGKAAVPALLRALQDKDVRVRLSGVEALKLIGPEATAAVPPLEKLLKDDNKEVRTSALLALPYLGPASIPVFMQEIRRGNEGVADLLLGMGEQAVPAISAALQGERIEVRNRILVAVYGRPEPAAALLPALLRTLEDADLTIRALAIGTLGRMRPVARNTLAKLAHLLEREEEGSWAAEALGGVGEAGLPVLRRAFLSGNPNMRARALIGLAKMGVPAFSLLTAALNDHAADNRCRAIDGLKACYPAIQAALPLLLRARKDKDPAVRVTSIQALGELPAPPREAILALADTLLFDSHGAVRLLALFTLERQGAAALPAVPALLRVIETNKQLRRGAVQLLGQLKAADRATVLRLCAVLRDTDEQLRLAAISSLQEIGPAARRITVAAGAAGEVGQAASEAVTLALLRALRDPSVHVRIAAAFALRQVGYPAHEAVPLLTAILTDRAGRFASPEGIKIRNEAAKVLGALGPVAAPAVPALVLALRESDLCGTAAEALGNIGPAAKEAIPALANNVFRREGMADAVVALAKLGRPAIPFLKKAMASKEVEIRRCAVCFEAEALRPMGRELLPGLIRAVSDSDDVVRARAIVSLWHLGPLASEAVPALAATLSDEDMRARRNACEALRKIGPAARAAVPALTDLLLEQDPYVRREAILALKAIGPGVPGALLALTETFADRDRYVALFAADALADLGPAAAAALPALYALLEGQDSELRVAGALGVWKIRRQQQEVVPLLRAALKERAGSVRVAAAAALWQVERNKEAVPLLLALMGSREAEVGWRAAAALEDIRPPAREVAPALRHLLGHDNADVRQAAEQLLEKLVPRPTAGKRHARQ